MNLVERLAALLPKPRVIYDREGGTPYLSRWYLMGQRFEDSDHPVGRSRMPVSLFLHRFHRSDDDGALHSHPWRWAVSLVLARGYSEERRVGDSVVRRHVRPLRLNFIHASDYHRVDLVNGEAWTLFLAGPRAGTWHFWDRETKCRAHWRAFIDWKRGARPDAGWELDSREGA